MSDQEQLRTALRAALNMVEDLSSNTNRLSPSGRAEFARLNMLAASGVVEHGNKTWKEIPADKVFGAMGQEGGTATLDNPLSLTCPNCHADINVSVTHKAGGGGGGPR